MAQEFINSLNETCGIKKWTMDDFNKGHVFCYDRRTTEGLLMKCLCQECELKVKNRFANQAKMLCRDCISTWYSKVPRQIYLDDVDLRYCLKGDDWLCDDCALEFITLKEIKEDLDELKELVKKLIDSKI